MVVEYAQNDEAMIRDEYWKLIYERNARRRTDGYDTERPLKPNQFRLYDLFSDPARNAQRGGRSEERRGGRALTELLVEHLVKTARNIDEVPIGADPVTILDYCVQPRDVPKPGKRE